MIEVNAQYLDTLNIQINVQQTMQIKILYNLFGLIIKLFASVCLDPMALKFLNYFCVSVRAYIGARIPERKLQVHLS